jgi:hypothetical protein
MPIRLAMGRDGCDHCSKKKELPSRGAASCFLSVRYNHNAFRREKIPRQECDGSVGVGCSLALYGA